MSLLFDSFPSREKAEAFANEVERKFGRSWQIFEDEASSFEFDPFPFRLKPPIVQISRRTKADDFDFPAEPKIMRLVRKFGGQFAGT